MIPWGSARGYRCRPARQFVAEADASLMRLPHTV